MESQKKRDFLNLLEYSPYHSIDKIYVSPLITTSARDDRWFLHTHINLQLDYKSCNHLIYLLRVESRAGHGAGTSRDTN